MRVSTNTPVLNHKLTILMGLIVMVKACSGFLTDTGTRIVSNEMTTESKLSDKDLQDWRFYQNHHPLSHAMNRNKVSIEPRIVNGINVNPPDKYSFMGALRIFEPLDENHSCGVTLITRTIALSAAHCFYDLISDYYVTFGDYDYNDFDLGDSYKVKKFRLHEDYDNYQLHNDIMLIELEDAVDEKYDVMPLNNGSVFDVESYSGSVVATGWGLLEFEGDVPTHLLETTLPLLSPQSCDDYLNSEDSLYSLLISSYDSRGKVCAGGDGTTDTCQGDSGGPIFYVNTAASPSPQYLQLGIVSFGQECALAGHPGVYTDVEYYYGWIQNVLCSGNDFEGTNTSSFCDDILAVNPSASPSPYSVPGLSPACAEEVIELILDEELNDALNEAFDSANCNSLTSTCTFSDSGLEIVRDACNESNGTFYSDGFSYECSGDSATFTNYPWCIGRSCTFDEYFEFESSLQPDNCTAETDPSASALIIPFSNRLLFASGIIMMLLFI